MLHEVVSPWGRGQTLKHNALAAVTRLMALLAVKRADRVLISVPAWRNVLATFLTPPEVTWLPVPTCLPTELPAGSKEARARLRSGHAAIIGHFGTYSPLITPPLHAALPQLLRSDPRRLGLLLGRGSEAFAAQLLTENPDLDGRVEARAGLAPEDVAASLSACDVVLQPYPDGISTRRTTAMASLALGLPVVTNAGPLSEPLWSESGAVALASDPSGRALAAAVEALLESPGRRADLGERGRALYQARFSLQRTVETLRGLAREDEKAALP
jgi:glycosyltransferase involved in cell wall biosynthesis